MSLALKSYDPGQVSFIAAGKICDGYSDGAFLTVARNEDAWMYKGGVDGSGARAKNNNKSGRFTLTLLQTSDFNDVLSALANADALTGKNTFPVLVRDATGRSLYSALTAWVVKLPDSEYAKEVGTRQWVIETNALECFVGGGI